MEAGRFGEGKKNLPKRRKTEGRCGASRWSAVTLFGGTARKSESFPGGKSLKDAGASRWSAITFFSDTTKLVLDSGGLLMEAATVREWSAIVFLP